MSDLVTTLHRVLKRLFKTNLLPEKWRKLPIHDMPLLSLDLELTGLERDADIVSFGWVKCEQQQIQLGTACHEIVNTNADLQQSPTIHGLTNKDVAFGENLEQVMEQLLPMADTHIWVFHNAVLDCTALKRACDILSKPYPEIIHFDTLLMARYLLNKKQHPIGPKSLSLEACRKRYGLGEINAHNALADAMATAELAILQLNEFSPSGNEPMHHLLRTEALSLR